MKRNLVLCLALSSKIAFANTTNIAVNHKMAKFENKLYKSTIDCIDSKPSWRTCDRTIDYTLLQSALNEYRTLFYQLSQEAGCIDNSTLKKITKLNFCLSAKSNCSKMQNVDYLATQAKLIKNAIRKCSF